MPSVKRRKGNWIGHILRRICLLKHVIEGKREKGRSDENTKKKKQLLDDHEEARGYSKLKAEALDRTLWRTPCGIDCGLFKCITTFLFTHDTHFCECPDNTPTGMLYIKTTGLS